MQLIYRGVSYQSTSTESTTVKQGINGKYRGIPCQLQKVKDRTISGIFVLKYRGSEFIKVLNH